MSDTVTFKWKYIIGDHVEDAVGGDFRFEAKERIRCKGCGDFLIIPNDDPKYDHCYCWDEDSGEPEPEQEEVLTVLCPICDLDIDAEDFPMHLDEEHFS